ncbi:MAG TPA: 5-formyltetrahydrofolate cyclo-ligase [Syntrophomonadaceae bacterium]|nr:5-formyltetrahydrofolate cyclo-ligase [Syntrophomonadaceae bacterium]HNX29833.1 5-formyltetrahydrofolate cyclo-ligase [Syntrophomonadaceae bacterium]HPR92930.1 5-formyltetrahydrofolate cyclo-ligase [Syntrophomonadaceae bacterium]
MNIYDEDNMRKSLRQIMLTARGELSFEQVQELSGSIIAKLDAFKQITEAENIMCFLSIKNEVNLYPFIDQAREQGKRILVPRVRTAGVIEAVEYQLERTRKGLYGIIEPEGEPVEAKQIDAVLVPGLGFDYQGYRLGYGGGYYDRFLTLLREDTFICGVCYDFQVVETVFPQPQDKAVDWIVTDKSEVVIDWEHF